MRRVVASRARVPSTVSPPMVRLSSHRAAPSECPTHSRPSPVYRGLRVTRYRRPVSPGTGVSRPSVVYWPGMMLAISPAERASTSPVSASARVRSSWPAGWSPDRPKTNPSASRSSSVEKVWVTVSPGSSGSLITV